MQLVSGLFVQNTKYICQMPKYQIVPLKIVKYLSPPHSHQADVPECNWCLDYAWISVAQLCSSKDERDSNQIELSQIKQAQHSITFDQTKNQIMNHKCKIDKFNHFLHIHLPLQKSQNPISPSNCLPLFLDTQVSLAPTHVSKLVSKSVGPSHFRISNLWSVTVDQIKKFKKQSPSIFEFCFWEDPPHPQKCI